MAVHGSGAQTPLVHWLPVPHSASSRQSCAAPSAQAASHVVVDGLFPPPKPPPPTRQQTAPAAQLTLLEHAAVDTVSAGHCAASAAQLKAFIGPLQQVRLGATQKSPPPPQATAPLSTRLMGSAGSRFGSSAMLPGLPSTVLPELPPAAPGAGCKLPLPVVGAPVPAPAALVALSSSELLQASSTASAEQLNPRDSLRIKLRLFMIHSPVIQVARGRCLAALVSLRHASRPERPAATHDDQRSLYNDGATPPASYGAATHASGATRPRLHGKHEHDRVMFVMLVCASSRVHTRRSNLITARVLLKPFRCRAWISQSCTRAGPGPTRSGR